MRALRVLGRSLTVAICAVSFGLTLPSAAGARVFKYLGALGSSGSSDGQFVEPYGAAIGLDGTIYVSDRIRGRVTRFSYTGALLGGFGNPGSAAGDFSNPAGITVMPSGEVYVTDTGNNRIERFSASGAFIGQWGTTGAGNGQFSGPLGITTDGPWLYVADSGNSRIQKFSATGGWVREWSSPLVKALASDGALVHASQAAGIAATSVFGDAIGPLFANETNLGAGIARDGRSATTWWLTVPASGSSFVLRRFWNSGAIAEEIPLIGALAVPDPADLATDCRGTLLVVDHGGDRVLRFGDPAAPPPPCGTPAAALSTSALSLGQQRASTVGAPSQVSLVATGDGIDVSDVRVTGADADAFLVSSDGCSGRTSWPGASCSVSVRFAPTRAGDATATLSLTDATLGVTHAVSLAGAGIAEPTVGPGPQGPAGAQGPAGPQGSPGKAGSSSATATASCSARSARAGVVCKVRPATAKVTILLARGGRTYARGAGKGTVKLKVLRKLAKGRYSVTVTTSTKSTGSPLVLRKGL